MLHMAGWGTVHVVVGALVVLAGIHPAVQTLPVISIGLSIAFVGVVMWVSSRPSRHHRRRARYARQM